MRRIIPYVLLFAALSGCAGGSDKPRRTLTEAQRDSVIGASQLPGAGVVRRALDESGRERARAARMDSLFH